MAAWRIFSHRFPASRSHRASHCSSASASLWGVIAVHPASSLVGLHTLDIVKLASASDNSPSLHIEQQQGRLDMLYWKRLHTLDAKHIRTHTLDAGYCVPVTRTPDGVRRSHGLPLLHSGEKLPHGQNPLRHHGFVWVSPKFPAAPPLSDPQAIVWRGRRE